jgi:hypothetical protein
LFVGPNIWDESEIEVVNGEFIANVAASHGGGVFGRMDFVSTTFADNLAGVAGEALYSPNGSAFTMRSVVAWPDDIAASDVFTITRACRNPRSPSARTVWSSSTAIPSIPTIPTSTA